MSRKHKRRSDNRPVTQAQFRRGLARLQKTLIDLQVVGTETKPTRIDLRWSDKPGAIDPQRIERAVNG